MIDNTFALHPIDISARRVRRSGAKLPYVPSLSSASVTLSARRPNARLGYKGVQIPTWDSRLFDLEKAAESQTYVDEVKGICAANGVEITEISTHLQGQLVARAPDKPGWAPK